MAIISEFISDFCFLQTVVRDDLGNCYYLQQQSDLNLRIVAQTQLMFDKVKHLLDSIKSIIPKNYFSFKINLIL